LQKETVKCENFWSTLSASFLALEHR